MSDEQTTCKTCGAVILVLTAKETGGVCMVCARGSREEFDENQRRKRAHEAEQAAFRAGPIWQFWLRLTRTSLEQMTLSERLYFAVGCLRGDVFNGGLHQYFWSNGDSQYDDAVQGLITMGAERHLRLLYEAKRVLFGDGDIPSGDTLSRVMRTAMDDAETDARLSTLDRAFWDEPDDLWVALMHFGAHHGFFPAPEDRT